MPYTRVPAKKASTMIDAQRLILYVLCKQKAQERLWRVGSKVYEYDQSSSATRCEDFVWEDYAEMVYRDFLDIRTAELMELNGGRGLILVYEYGNINKK